MNNRTNCFCFFWSLFWELLFFCFREIKLFSVDRSLRENNIHYILRLLLWDIKFKDITNLEVFIKLKASKLEDCGGVIYHVEKNYFKTKFSKRKQSFRVVLLKSILKLLVNSLKNICDWIHFHRSCRLSPCNFTKGKLL